LSLRRLESTKDGDGNSTYFEYDQNGNQAGVKDARGNASYTEYDALEDTNDTDLAQDAKDRIVIIGVIYGDGAGNPIDTTEIFQEAVLSDHVTATYATGIQAISGINVTGHGLLSPPATFDVTEPAKIKLDVVSASTKNLSYKQAGEATYGASVNAATLNGTFTLTGNSGGQLSVEIAADMLTDSVSTIERNLTVERTYDPDGPLFSPSDLVHRHRAGTGTINDGNPHGMSVNDLAQAFLRLTRRMFVTGQANDLAESALPIGIWNEVSSLLGSTTKTLMWQWTPNNSGYGKVRFYLNGITKGVEITVNAAWDPTTSGYITDVVAAGRPAYRLSLIEQSATGAFVKVEAIETPTATFTTWGSTLLSTNLTSGALATLFDAFLTTTENDRARISMVATSTGDRTLLAEFRVKSALADAGSVRLYKVNSSGTYAGPGSTLELTLNSVYNHSSSEWSGESIVATTAWKLEFSVNSGLTLYTKSLATTATFWADTVSAGTWALRWSLDSGGNLNAAKFPYTTNVTRHYSSGIEGALLTGVAASTVDSAPELLIGGTGATPTKSLYVLLSSGASVSSAYLPVRLPHGAIVQDVRIRGLVTLTGLGQCRAALQIVALDDVLNNSTMRTTSPNYDLLTDTSGAIDSLALTIDRNQTIDNFNYAYHIWVSAVTVSGDAAVVRIHGIEVDYEMSEAF